jgi:glycosyltransferase involved in cell wall biosynthesis
MTELSVVIPVYGAEGCLDALHRRLSEQLPKITDDYEIVYVEDRSPDASWDGVRRLAATDPRVRALRLSRNFGQHAAITAGLAQSTGRWVVVMDCDLQDPPEEIPHLYAVAQRGHDVVLTRRAQRFQSPFRRWAGRAYFRARNVFLGTDMDSEYASLSVISRKVVDAFLGINDRDRQYMLILHWLGFDHVVVETAQADRHSGRSSYTLSSLVRVAVDGMFFQTTKLLRWIVYLGFAVAASGLLLAALLVVWYVAADPLPGWTSLAVLILLIGGFTIVTTGVTGLYIGKIFEQVKGRPLYVVDERLEGQVRAAEADEVPTAGLAG